jgi:hypothetical protein
VKYKRIPALLHNFTDSFMSLVNYSDNGYAMDDLQTFLRESRDGAVTARWLPSLEVSGGDLPKNIRETLSRYAKWLPILARSMSVDVARIASMTTVFSLDGGRVRADTVGTDDRGRTFKVPAKFWD